MQTTSYTLWSLDVWGNEKDGYEVNDRCCMSRDFRIDCKEAQPTDEEVCRALVSGGYLKPRFRMDIGGDDLVIEVNHKASGRPLFTLEWNECKRQRRVVPILGSVVCGCPLCNPE